VIDIFEAKKRLRSKELPAFPPRPILRTLAVAEEFKRLLNRGDVNQAGLAHLYGFTRARVTELVSYVPGGATALALVKDVFHRHAEKRATELFTAIGVSIWSALPLGRPTLSDYVNSRRVPAHVDRAGPFGFPTKPP
jgi:hypothetical protein